MSVYGPAAAVEATGLVKRYGERCVVDGISFQVGRGQCVGFLGPNGAGKTTTLRMLQGTVQPSGGSLRVLGHAVPAEGAAARARMGVVPQQDNLDPDFTVAENLAVYASYFGVPPATAAARITALLDFVELADYRHAPIATLSGGMQRRLTIARALVNEPELIVLDEPTTGLDPQARHLLWAKLRELRRQGRTLLLTTHYLEEAERLCDEIIIIDHGRILERGAPRALAARHIGGEVLEVHEQAEAAQSLLRNLPGIRTETVGGSLYAYLPAGTAPVDALRVAGIPCLLRPANLEDVFLKLTGRDLRDS
jgi:lipooligosaccharide transport system ATP-binding protein